MSEISHQKCRLCCSEKEKLFDMFSDHGIRLDMAGIINTHFGFLQINDVDDESNFVCTTCWWKIENFHMFYTQILEIGNKLIEIVETIDEDLNEDEDVDFKEEGYILSEDCIETSIDKDEQIEAIEEVREASIAEVKHENEDIQKIQVANATNNPEKELNETKKTNPVKCERPIEVNKLIREYFTLSCDDCSIKAFSSFKEFREHFMVAHNTKGYLICCSRKFFTRSQAVEHIRRHLNPEQFCCILCDKIFANQRGLKNHTDIAHMPEKDCEYQCNQCSKKFIKKFQLDLHLSRHTANMEKRFKCEECGKAFGMKTILQTHIKSVHEGAYVHVCDICAKVFKSKMFFESHKKLYHSAEKPAKVQCELCGVYLKHDRSLRNHMQRHKDLETTHVCNICGKQTKTGGALKSHIKYSHRDNRIFDCEVCGKAFKRAVTLKEHMTLHTGEVLYKCNFCTKTFNSAANMYAHRKRKHLLEWEEHQIKRNESE